jgi:wyosine [tRNA(Phe)-imidazoG37] synthetase (radical SAM superfamily)
MTAIEIRPRRVRLAGGRAAQQAFGYPRDFLGGRFVYTVVSPRARGLSIGINLNPDQKCNFDCAYCEVNRSRAPRDSALDLSIMADELRAALEQVCSNRVRERPCYRKLPDDLLKLRHVALSGDGEPTLCPVFLEVVQTVVHIRACGPFPFFRLVLITNATGLDRLAVQQGLELFTPRDEIWAKLDAGTQEYMDRINKPDCSIEKIIDNILRLARRRPVVIQSLFPSLFGLEPPSAEIEAYVQRLRALKDAGAQISRVQIYSATRPTPHSECGHLPLRTLTRIAQRVRDVAGLEAEVF